MMRYGRPVISHVRIFVQMSSCVSSMRAGTSWRGPMRLSPEASPSNHLHPPAMALARSKGCSTLAAVSLNPNGEQAAG